MWRQQFRAIRRGQGQHCCRGGQDLPTEGWGAGGHKNTKGNEPPSIVTDGGGPLEIMWNTGGRCVGALVWAGHGGGWGRYVGVFLGAWNLDG